MHILKYKMKKIKLFLNDNNQKKNIEEYYKISNELDKLIAKYMKKHKERDLKNS